MTVETRQASTEAKGTVYSRAYGAAWAALEVTQSSSATVSAATSNTVIPTKFEESLLQVLANDPRKTPDIAYAEDDDL